MQLRIRPRPVYHLESLTLKKKEKDYAFWRWVSKGPRWDIQSFPEVALALMVKKKQCIVIFICCTGTVYLDTGLSTSHDTDIIAAICLIDLWRLNEHHEGEWILAFVVHWVQLFMVKQLDWEPIYSACTSIHWPEKHHGAIQLKIRLLHVTLHAGACWHKLGTSWINLITGICLHYWQDVCQAQADSICCISDEMLLGYSGCWLALEHGCGWIGSWAGGWDANCLNHVLLPYKSNC